MGFTDRLYPIHFETDMGGMAGAGPGVDATEEVDDETTEDVDNYEWQGPSQDEWNAVIEYQKATVPVMNQLGEFLNAPPEQYQQYQEQGGEQQEDTFDPYDEGSVQQYIQQNIQAGIEQALGPFQGILGTIASREGETLAKGELDRIAEEVGKFDKDNAFLVANSLLEQGADPTEALTKAAMYSKEFEARIRADEREQFKAELQNLAGAPRETGTGSSSAVENVGVPTGPDRYRVAVERALGNGSPVHPAG